MPIIEWSFGIVLAIAVAVGIRHLPRLLERRSNTQIIIGRLSDEYFSLAQELSTEETTPIEILEFIREIGAHFASPSLVRHILFAAAQGRLKKYSELPPESVRKFWAASRSMPQQSKDKFSSAIARALLASALNSPVAGRIFLNFMLPDSQQRDNVRVYTSELVASGRVAA